MKRPATHDRWTEDRWTAFAVHDRTLRAPQWLEARVMTQLDQPRAAAPRRSWRPAVAAGMAAAVLVGVAFWLRDPEISQPTLVARPLIGMSIGEAMPTVASAPSSWWTAPVVAVPADAEPPLLPPPLLSLTMAPMYSGEALQIVRVRMPSEMLLSLGLTIAETYAGSAVMVDVLVGEDGLPRDIRRVSVGQE